MHKSNVFTYFRKYKHYIIVVFLFLLVISITFYTSFAYYKVNTSRSLISGKAANFQRPDVEIHYMIENRKADGSGNGTYYSSYSPPIKDYVYDEEISGCTNDAEFIKTEDNHFIITSDGKTKCEFYFSALNINTNEDISLTIKKERKLIDGSGSEIYESVTDTTIAGLILSGYIYNESKSGCSNGASIEYDPYLKRIKTNSNSGAIDCTAYFDITNNVEVNFYATNGATMGSYKHSTNKGGSLTTTFNLPSGISADEVVLTCDKGIVGNLNSTTINLTEINNSGTCIIGLPTKYEILGASIFTPLVSGYYKLQLWGAQGGNSGGRGGYAEGIIYFTNSSTVTVTVGGEGFVGSENCDGAGINGGGCAYSNAGGGGGASDIRVIENYLENRVIVAAGGGGKGNDSCAVGAPAGIGGQFQGTCNYQGGSGSLVAGGAAGYSGSILGNVGSFGLGANGKSNTYNGGGGGAGWFGGGSGYSASSWSSGGGGGSSFVFTDLNENLYVTSRYFLKGAKIYSGNETFLSPTLTSETGHTGDGFVKITLVGF